jgi:hypothetical protein
MRDLSEVERIDVEVKEREEMGAAWPEKDSKYAPDSALKV